MDKNSVVKVSVTFALLLGVGVTLGVLARQVDDLATQMLLIGIGCALVGGSLAFYLNQMFTLERQE
jgi:Na+/citrate or Na+/malate symporter